MSDSDVLETDGEPVVPATQDDTVLPPLSELKLEMAQERLGQMTAEDLLEMQEQAVDAAEQTEMPEARASITVKLYSTNGGEVMLTTRSASAARAWDDMLRGIRYVMKTAPNMNWSPARPKAPTAPVNRPAPEMLDTPVGPAPFPADDPAPANEPQRVPVGQEDVQLEPVRVHRVKHIVTSGGKHLVKVLGAPGSGLSVHGVNAWPESLPPTVRKIFETWDVNREYQPSASLAIAYVERAPDGKPLRVRSFAKEA
jgi:hypothetical protein